METMHHPQARARRTPWHLALLALLGLSLLPASLATARSHHHHAAATHAEATAGQFDYYLLSMSWSPTYCLTHPENRAECGGRGYGLILHGLWPQYESGGYPEACASDERLDAEAQRIGATLYPSPSLLRHEWERHGSCSGLSAVDYLHAADRASALLKLPPVLEAPHHDQVMKPEQLLQLLHQANPSLPDGAVRIACTRDQLSEIRLCITRDLQFRECGRGVGGHCPSDHVTIPATR